MRQTCKTIGADHCWLASDIRVLLKIGRKSV